jgi:glycosyltransferase involved in cell wall biosynthesis
MPAYNEASCIGRVICEVRRRYRNVVVVDDGSTDHTYEEARGVATYLLRHSLNRGQGAALQTGIEFAVAHGAQYVVTFDSDGQHNPDDIEALVMPLWREECDISLGSRFLGEAIDVPPSRRLLLRMAVLFTRMMNGVALTDAHNGFRAFSRRAAKKINITLDGMAHASEVIDFVAQSGLPYREVPVRIRYTEYSLSKGQSSRGAIRILFHYLLGRFVR